MQNQKYQARHVLLVVAQVNTVILAALHRSGGLAKGRQILSATFPRRLMVDMFVGISKS